MSDITALVIVFIVVVMLVAFVIALFLSYRLARNAQEQNRRLMEEMQTRQTESSAVSQLNREKMQLCHAADTVEAVSALPDDQLTGWIVNQVQEKRLFVNPDMNLRTVAKDLGLTQKRISNALATSDYGSLAELLTVMRLDYACRLLESKPEWTVEAVLNDAGFSSRRTFQKVFKERLGVTPSQYRTLKHSHAAMDTHTHTNN
ncbi:MAG: AraC family transcriptional regulator [Paludibacteraceae bacterium]|nr:AraC family transcriptional regulator [Paludibacteraceae bacterium]MBQ6748447.1 AraC family transcriptional regulator [Paludibacteraceae bacterium]